MATSCLSEFIESDIESKICAVCGSEDAMVCSGCKSIYYCGKDHQKLNWKVHRSKCLRLQNVRTIKLKQNVPNQTQNENQNVLTVSGDKEKLQENKISEIIRDLQSDTSVAFHDHTFNDKNLTSVKQFTEISDSSLSVPMDLDLDVLLNDIDMTEGRFNSRSDILTDFVDKSEFTFQDIITDNDNLQPLAEKENNTSDSEAELSPTGGTSYQPVSLLRSVLTKDVVKEIKQLPFISQNVSDVKPNSSDDPMAEQFFTQISNYILKCLFKYGVCVIDNFLGDDIAYALLSETAHLFTKEMFTTGQIVGSDSDSNGLTDKETRGDRVIWLDDIEDDLPALALFVARLDAVMAKCSGQCGHVIKTRSKIMLSCYPSKGTKYKKHVDNSANDGRCVTCLYYQNKNWDSKVQGGMLRVYPKDEKHIANIEPIFDRLVLFWSNERCPHKVFPVYADRYAVTMWYYDFYEREQHLQKLNSQSTETNG